MKFVILGIIAIIVEMILFYILIKRSPVYDENGNIIEKEPKNKKHYVQRSSQKNHF